MLDIKDQVMQDRVPTLMAPKLSQLPDLEMGRYRYLMAGDGLWVEARQIWGHFRQMLWESPTPLPYGLVEPLLHLDGGPIPSGLLAMCIANALYKAERKKEWAGWITYNHKTELYNYLPLIIIHESGTRVEYKYPELPDEEYLVFDLHSHPFDMAAFSHVDDTDNMGGVRLAGVISFNEDLVSKLTVRLCLEGHFFEIDNDGLWAELCK